METAPVIAMETREVVSSGDAPAASENRAAAATVNWQPPRSKVSPAMLAALAVVAGLGAIGLGAAALVSLGLGQESAGQAPPDGSRAALALLAKPSSERIPFEASGGSAVLAVGPAGRAAIVLRGFPPAGTGRVYHAWVTARGARPVRAAVFTGDEPAVLLTVPVVRRAAVSITSEPVLEAAAPSVRPTIVARRGP